MSLKIEAEVKLETEPCVLSWGGKLFVGTEDGSIKSFDANLTPAASWQAHAARLFALTAGAGKVYSSSNDGGVRVWTAEGKMVTELTTNMGFDVTAITVVGSDVITGDEGGNVFVYENNEPRAMYNVLEEVKELQYRPPYMFTVRDLDVSVTEITPDKSKTRFVTRHSMEGRAPIKLHGQWLLVSDRSGKNLRLHYASVDKEFKLLHEVKVSDMLITSISAKEDYVWTGGWDGHIKRWQITGDQLIETGDINVGSCVNALVEDSNNVYAAVAGGTIIKIKG